MPVPVTSMKWRVQFQRTSATDNRFFYADIDPATISKSQLADIVKTLVALGYDNVSFQLMVVLPP